MKTLKVTHLFIMTTIILLLATLTACSTTSKVKKVNTSNTNHNAIPQITDIDLQYASHKAKLANKSLMIVYTNDNCTTCKQWLNETLEKLHTNNMLKHFEIKSVSLQKGIDVVCPSGIELDNEEFYEAKGIEGDLSIVFHNDIGEVVFTYGEQPNTSELNHLLHYIKLEKIPRRYRF